MEQSFIELQSPELSLERIYTTGCINVWNHRALIITHCKNTLSLS